MVEPPFACCGTGETERQRDGDSSAVCLKLMSMSMPMFQRWLQRANSAGVWVWVVLSVSLQYDLLIYACAHHIRVLLDFSACNVNAATSQVQARAS